jgi:hypothetical protein
MNLPCQSYCEHGGVCELDEGHDGLHDSSYCKWDDAHAIPKADADAKARAIPGGEAVVMLEDLTRAMLGQDAS